MSLGDADPIDPTDSAAPAEPSAPSALSAAYSAVPTQWACVGLGGNLGEVERCLGQALRGMQAWPATRLVAVSSPYRSSPVDAQGPDYINAVAVLQSALGPHELLRSLLSMELQFARTRAFWHAPRTLDLDLLAYGATTVQTADLSLPHPRMGERAFVLLPLAQALAQLPQDGRAMAEAALPPLPSAERQAELARSQGIECLPRLPLWWQAEAGA